LVTGTENDHVGMRSLILFLSHRKYFLSVWYREKVESELNRKAIK